MTIDPLSATAGDPAAVPLITPTCVHGDAHLGNILWRDGRVVALMGFEWARLRPPDLELEPFLRGDPDAGKDAEAATRMVPLCKEVMLGGGDVWLPSRKPAMMGLQRTDLGSPYRGPAAVGDQRA